MNSIDILLDDIQLKINQLSAQGVPATLLITWRDGSLLTLSADDAVQVQLEDSAAI